MGVWVTGADHLGLIDRSVTDVGTRLDRQASGESSKSTTKVIRRR
jgi:hypothetical protein